MRYDRRYIVLYSFSLRYSSCTDRSISIIIHSLLYHAGGYRPFLGPAPIGSRFDPRLKQQRLPISRAVLPNRISIIFLLSHTSNPNLKLLCSQRVITSTKVDFNFTLHDDGNSNFVATMSEASDMYLKHDHTIALLLEL